jgi:hypothetical protein
MHSQSFDRLYEGSEPADDSKLGQPAKDGQPAGDDQPSEDDLPVDDSDTAVGDSNTDTAVEDSEAEEVCSIPMGDAYLPTKGVIYLTLARS